MNPATQNDNAGRQPGEVGTANNYESNFTYPQRGTQPARLLAMLLRSGRINPLEAWQELGIYRVSDTVFQLRGMDWPITTSRLDVANQFNESCRVAEYILDAEAIAQAGHDGDEFAWRELEAMASTRRDA
jgi:hypothetical protein